MTFKRIQILWLLAGLLLLFQTSLMASDIPPRPNPPRLVNDFAGILTQGEINSLEYKLRYFNDSTSNQIVVVTVKSLNDLQPYEFATKLGEQWKVGQKKFDNGVVILIKPKFEGSRGQAYIASGYGLEGVIPDATCKNIVENEMIPSFRQGDYYGGINKAVNVVMKMASGEISAKGYNKMHQSTPFAALVPFIVIFLIFMLIKVSNAHSYSVGNRGTSIWTALFLGSMLGGGSNQGGWNNFTGGGGGSGFGGGFGGFGGGGFGGGGAGGSW